MERINSYEMGFRKGYFKALLDEENWFSEHSDSLKYHKMYNAKMIPKVLHALVDGRESLMKTGDAEIVYNKKNETVSVSAMKSEE